MALGVSVYFISKYYSLQTKTKRTIKYHNKCSGKKTEPEKYILIYPTHCSAEYAKTNGQSNLPNTHPVLKPQ